MPRTVKVTVDVNFRQGRSVLDVKFGNNEQALRAIVDSLQAGSIATDSVYRLTAVEVIGGASPEGSVALNKGLSERRANVLFNYISRYGDLPDSLKKFTYIGRDWAGLLTLVKDDAKVPNRDKAIELLEDIVRKTANGERESDRNFSRLFFLCDSRPYFYMYKHLFPPLRASRLALTYERVPNPVYIKPLKTPQTTSFAEIPVVNTDKFIPAPVMPSRITPKPEKNFYMGLRSNLLYDLALVPNIGAEFYVGKGFTVGGNWMYAWWSSNRHHNYWRIYGGDIALRKYFGSKAAEKPMQGHHLGVYAQMFTYDFELGGKGVIGGVPGGTLWDKMHYGGGVEYGYSLPIKRRLNLDFSVALGYVGGEYWEYKPMDGHYVWQATKQRNYWGPTKVEVSLVWLIGHGNYNKEKGGEQ